MNEKKYLLNARNYSFLIARRYFEAFIPQLRMRAFNALMRIAEISSYGDVEQLLIQILFRDEILCLNVGWGNFATV